MISDTCHICEKGQLKLEKEFPAFYRVTSDTKPWSKGGELGVCSHCGTIQKRISEKWQSEISEIYAEYELYYQSDSYDQILFDDDGNPCEKNMIILNNMNAKASDIFSEKGTLLDIGCGRGAFLRSFIKYRPEWTIVGNDISNTYESEIIDISDKASFISGGIENIQGRYNAISLCHVLEHVVDPLSMLLSLYNQVEDDGILFIQVPNVKDNPFDLFVADHCTHFCKASLRNLLEAAGYKILYLEHTWAYKELSAIVCKSDTEARPQSLQERALVQENTLYIQKSLARLKEITGYAREISKQGDIGIFGTAVAGIWLDLQMGGVAKFFLDEDKGRVNKTFMGRPVVSPQKTPTPIDVLIPIRIIQAETIAQRIQRQGVSTHILSLDD